jgi:hypothetical protein
VLWQGLALLTLHSESARDCFESRGEEAAEPISN